MGLLATTLEVAAVSVGAQSYPGAGDGFGQPGGAGGAGGAGGGGMGGGGRQHGGHAGGGNSPIDPRVVALARTYDPDDPVALMLAARADLKLTDTEAVALHPIERQLMSANRPVRETLDSLRPPGDSARAIDWSHITPPERDSIIQTRKAIAVAIGVIHDNVIRARAASLAVLTPDQQQRFADVEEKVTAALRAGLPEETAPPDGQAPSTGRGGGRGGGGNSPSSP